MVYFAIYNKCQRRNLVKSIYQVEHLWKGRKAITELKKVSGLRPKVIESWMRWQALWQVHIPPQKNIDYANYYVDEVNKIHYYFCPMVKYIKTHRNIVSIL